MTKDSVHKARQNKKRCYKKRTRDLWNTRREIQTQTKLDQPTSKSGRHPNPETRPQLQTSRKKRSWTTQETMATRRCRNRSKEPNPWRKMMMMMMMILYTQTFCANEKYFEFKKYYSKGFSGPANYWCYFRVFFRWSHVRQIGNTDGRELKRLLIWISVLYLQLIRRLHEGERNTSYKWRYNQPFLWSFFTKISPRSFVQMDTATVLRFLQA